jgi:hypothetical protein
MKGSTEYDCNGKITREDDMRARTQRTILAMGLMTSLALAALAEDASKK